MKKYLLLLVLSLLFIVPIGANAATKNMRIDFDSHDKFNYFYEYKNSTPFYHFLVSQGSDLKNTLSAYSYINPDSKGLTIRIYYRSELNIDALNVSIPNDAYYFIVTDCINPNNDVLALRFNGLNAYFDYGYLEYGSYIQNRYLLGNSNSYSKLFYFDKSANFLGVNSLTTNNFDDLLLDVEIFDISKINNSDFTYFISKFYYFSDNFVIYSNDFNVIISDLLLDGEVYLIDNNENYSSFWATMRKIFSFGDVKDYDVSDSFLDYFRYNKVYEKGGNISSLCHMLVINDSSSLPENYVAINFTNYKNGFYLVPKRSDISSRYFIAQPTNKNVILSSKLFDISSDKVIYTEDNDIYNNVIDFNYLDECVSSSDLYHCSIKFTINDADFIYSNYIYYFSIDSVKYDFWFYYNSLDFDLHPVADSDLNFINPNSGNSILFDNSSQRDYLFNVNGYKSTYAGDNSFNLDNFDLSSSGIFKTVTDFVSGFIPTITSIFALIFLMFSSLPTEIQYLFYFLLIGGIIIIIYKLIRG